MITDLFVVTSGIEGVTLAGVVPPACRREPSRPAAVTAIEDGLLLELPEWRPRAPARHLVPSLSVLTDVPYAVRFELSGGTGGAWSPWASTATIGQRPSRSRERREASVRAPERPRRAADPGQAVTTASESPLACDIDVYTAAAPVDRVRMRIRVEADDVRTLATAPWIATLSACDLAPPGDEATGRPAAPLPVPALSQLDAPAEIALSVCSPTSVAMVLAYWGRPTPLLPLAAEIFHAETNRYGVWPAAIHAAGRHGIAGYLLRFPDWTSAAWCLQRKLPIIASLRYTAGELTNAPIAETSGHLVVLTGSDPDHACVNDPVAPTAVTVPRCYRLEEFKRAWLERTGIGYVLFPPSFLISSS